MNIDSTVLDLLYEKAKESFDNEEIPVAAAIFDSKTNQLICVLGNNRQSTSNVLGHAEINCILEAEKSINDWRLDGFYMVVSLEPCDMCSMVIKESRLDHVYYLLPGLTNSKYDILGNKSKLLIDDVYTKKFNDLLTIFFDNKR